ncbi:MAG TPA: hypothetical protein VIL17_05270 [Coriobacteriia bacterium]
MSKPVETVAVPVAPITLDDIRHKALHIRDEVVEEAREQVSERRGQIIIIGVVAVVAALSLVYYVGTRAGRAACEPPTR